ncbi:MAG: ABC transporter permease subunit [Candidatus Omnitrophica bacterium]|nr:ABC transporter permease subunit [Candidatus Omnitrophota bacterium]
MLKTFDIAMKESAGYFRSPLAYVILTVALTVFNAFFFLIIDQNREAALTDVFRVMEFMFVFLIPLLTMKTLAEEKQTGTLEFLLTTPTTEGQIICGKYLGTLFFVSILVAITGIYYGILASFASPEAGMAFAGYLGIWLEAAFFIAVGIFCSGLTGSHLLAAILAYAVLFGLYFLKSFNSYLHGPAETVLRYAAVMTHSENFFVGIIAAADLAYLGSGILIFLLLSIIFLRKR